MNTKEQLAKQAIELYITKKKVFSPENISEEFKEYKSCFVTITKDSELRGCIGTIEPTRMLYEEIVENAISAATRDRRFYPVTKDELTLLEYEVSVLTPPTEYTYKDNEELLEEIKDKGVIINKNGMQAVYLPQVWEHFKNAEDFLSSLCEKAGLKGNIWKNEKIEVRLFEKE